MQEQLVNQISTWDTLSRELKNSEAVNSYLNTTIDGLTKKLEALNQTVRLLCWRIKDVSLYGIDALIAFTDVLWTFGHFKLLSNTHVSFKFPTAIIRIAFEKGLKSLALCALFCCGFETVMFFD